MQEQQKADNHLRPHESDKLIAKLNGVIGHCIRLLAVMMVLVIILCILDVGLVLYEKLASPPHFLLELNDIFAVFASFLAVLIAIEIFANNTLS